MLSFVFIVALLAAAAPHPLREAGAPLPPGAARPQHSSIPPEWQEGSGGGALSDGEMLGTSGGTEGVTPDGETEVTPDGSPLEALSPSSPLFRARALTELLAFLTSLPRPPLRGWLGDALPPIRIGVVNDTLLVAWQRLSPPEASPDALFSSPVDSILATPTLSSSATPTPTSVPTSRRRRRQAPDLPDKLSRTEQLLQEFLARVNISGSLASSKTSVAPAKSGRAPVAADELNRDFSTFLTEYLERQMRLEHPPSSIPEDLNPLSGAQTNSQEPVASEASLASAGPYREDDFLENKIGDVIKNHRVRRSEEDSAILDGLAKARNLRQVMNALNVTSESTTSEDQPSLHDTVPLPPLGGDAGDDEGREENLGRIVRNVVEDFFSAARSLLARTSALLMNATEPGTREFMVNNFGNETTMADINEGSGDDNVSDEDDIADEEEVTDAYKRTNGTLSRRRGSPAVSEAATFPPGVLSSYNGSAVLFIPYRKLWSLSDMTSHFIVEPFEKLMEDIMYEFPMVALYELFYSHQYFNDPDLGISDLFTGEFITKMRNVVNIPTLQLQEIQTFLVTWLEQLPAELLVGGHNLSGLVENLRIYLATHYPSLSWLKPASAMGVQFIP